jgi:glycerol-1-phosphate dehydrogenase [NAD(P)+]
VKQTFQPESLLGSTFECECGRVHTVPVRKMVLDEGAHVRLPEVLAELSLPRDTCIVADDNTYDVLGTKVARLLGEARYGIREVVIPSPPGGTVKADQPTADKLLSSLPSVPLLIAVGSGTINDLTKLAASRRGVPYVVVATAPSMNGYTSSIVALTVDGLKTTSEAHPPVGVVADLDVLVEAPMELITSGLGDIVSKPVSTADWKLAQIVSGEYFCSRPIGLVTAFEPQFMGNPVGIRDRQPEAIRALTEALLYSGISMVIAGSSSPASGGEHLISHTIDMQADLRGRQHDHHGTQVGVATIFSAALYERVLAEDIASFDVEALVARQDERRRRELERYWGRFANVVGEELAAKTVGRDEQRDRMAVIQGKWGEIRSELRQFLRPWSQIQDVLREAGGATRIADIGLSLEQFREAVLHGREMRRRYTILDLADEFGLLEKHLDDVIRETRLWAE